MNSPIRGASIKKKNTIWNKIRKRGGVEMSNLNDHHPRRHA